MMTKRITIHKIIFSAMLIILTIVLLFGEIHRWREQKAFQDAEGRIVVVFHEDIEDNELKLLLNKFDKTVTIEKHIEDYALLSVKNAVDFQDTLDYLSSEPKVLSAQANFDIHILSYDPYADAQWYISNPGYYRVISGSRQWSKTALSGIDMGAGKAWEIMKNSGNEEREVIVAIIDTGVDSTHPELVDQMWVNSGEIAGDGKDNDGNGYIDDINGWDFYNNDATICHYEYSQLQNKYIARVSDNDNHGTHIAGIIAAASNNDVGIAGIASNINVKLMALKINGGDKGMGEVSDAIEAVKYATMMGADICNLSWGTTVYMPRLEEIMRESDVLFVAAAGNDGVDNDEEPMYPASFNLDNLISVTSINADGELTDYSNYGAESVDLAAPGDEIFSTIIGGYAMMSGSSMAAPQVSGVAALLYSYKDHLFASNVKSIITDNILPIPELEGLMIYPGISSASQAVASADDLIQDSISPELTFHTIYNKDEMSIPIDANDEGDSDIRVIRWIYGKKTLKDFKRGMDGTLVKDGNVVVTKGGIYTFYASDYAGNEIIKNYTVVADTAPPIITLSYAVSNDYAKRTVTVKASDNLSGLKQVKYMSGIKSADEFLSSGAGTEIKLKDGKGTFSVQKDGTYTVFAKDYRGNTTVKAIVVKTIKSTKINFSVKKKSIKVGDQYTLKTSILPVNTTDKVTFTSSNKKVATVTSKGKVTALAKGKTYIKVVTSSGKTATFVVTVK